MSVVSRNRQSRPIPSVLELTRIADVAFAEGRGEPGLVGVAFVDDREMTEFHGDFLGKEHTTDVLSFPGDVDEDPEYRGDVVVCTDQAARQALGLGIPYPAELGILTLHGILHLLGYDHTVDDGSMTRLEEALRPRALRAMLG
jgi:probable rRNA maturation factor